MRPQLNLHRAKGRSLSALRLLALLVPLGAASCQKQSPSGAAQSPYPTPTVQTNLAAAPGPAPYPIPSTPAPFATPPLLPGTPDVAGLVEKIKPAVVNITAVHELRVPKMEDNFPFGFDPFSHGLRSPGDQVRKQQALGSGFLIEATDHVGSNVHVSTDY